MNPAHTLQSKKLTKPLSLALVTTLLTGLLVLPQHLFAQDSLVGSGNQITLTAIPPRLGDDNTLLIKPGEKKQVQVRVRNSSDNSISVLSTISDFIIDEDGETPIPVEDDVSNRWSLAEWVTIVPQSQTLKPQETGVINVLIDVPSDALPGGHYAMITHQPSASASNPVANADESNSASGVFQRVGTLLYAVVEGDINEEAFIRDFNFPKFTEYGPVPFSFSVENTSDIHIQPKTKIEITDMFGRKVDDLTVDSKNVFPMVGREFSGEWGRVWGYGKYTAQATMSFGSAGKIAMAKVSFWLLPIKLIIAVLIGILTLIVVFMTIRRQIKKQGGDQNSKVEALEKQLHELEQKKLKELED